MAGKGPLSPNGACERGNGRTIQAVATGEPRQADPGFLATAFMELAATVHPLQDDCAQASADRLAQDIVRVSSDREERLVGVSLRRVDQNEVLPQPSGHLPQASQDLGLTREIKAKGCGSTVPSGREVRHVPQILGLKLATLLVRERLAVLPPRGDQQQPHQLVQADGNQSRASFGVGVEDRTLLSAFTAEEERAAGTIAGEPLKRGTRGEVHILDMIASVKVEVTRPSEKTGSFFPLTDGSDQRFHEPQPTSRYLPTIMGNQSHTVASPIPILPAVESVA